MNGKLLSAFALVWACGLGTGASAEPPPTELPAGQSADAPQSDVPPGVPVLPPCCRVPALTPVELEFVDPASSKTSHDGDHIRIRVAEPVLAAGKVVIPVGTEGFAEVIQASHGAIGGKAGELVIGAPYLTLAGQRIGLKRMRYGPASGKDRAGQAVVATAVIGIAGLLVSGGNIDIASGTRANAVLTVDTMIPDVPDHPQQEGKQ